MDEVALELRLTLPPGAAAPGVARHVVRSFAPLLPENVREATELLVSELVTNSFRHGGSPLPIELRLTATSNGGVRGEVFDLGEGFSRQVVDVRFPGTGATSGWGLFLVEHIAQRWGVIEDGGTTVWFEIDPPLRLEDQKRTSLAEKPEFAFGPSLLG